jgi:hypothetical protein
MRVELFRADTPDDVVAVLAWNDGHPVVESGAEVAGVAELLRPTPVQTDDPALRKLGTSGESVLTPGSLAWFRAAIATRAAALGFGVRFVTAEVRGGWDPASNYRRFESQVQRLQR